MDKLKMQTVNRADENFRALAALFPNVVTETITGYDEAASSSCTIWRIPSAHSGILKM